MGSPSQSCGMSPAIWDHDKGASDLALTSARQAGVVGNMSHLENSSHLHIVIM